MQRRGGREKRRGGKEELSPSEQLAAIEDAALIDYTDVMALPAWHRLYTASTHHYAASLLPRPHSKPYHRPDILPLLAAVMHTMVALAFLH